MKVVKATWYFSISSLLDVGYFPPLICMVCIMTSLWVSRMLQWWIRCSGVWSRPLHGHVWLSMMPKLCRYDLVFPCPDTMAVNAGEIGKLACTRCPTDGRNDLQRARLFVLSHNLCHFAIPSFFSPVTIVLFVVFSYSTFISPASAAASLASLSAISLPSIPVCDFTQPKWIVQFCVVVVSFSVHLQLLACV
jgi:hypothetical protein